jgi:hypothetical protein
MRGISVSDHCGQQEKEQGKGIKKQQAEARVDHGKNGISRNHDHVFSCRREDPTASSVLDHGEFDMISPAGLGPWGYAEVERWLLRVKPPQLPALPARTWPLTLGGPVGPGCGLSCP